MQIKKYLAPTLKEATHKMKTELGLEAIILGTRIIEDEKRFDLKKMYEITAGIDQPVHNNKPAVENLDFNSNFDSELEKLSDKIFGKEKKKNIPVEKTNQPEKQKQIDKKIEKQIKEIEGVLETNEVHKSIIKSLVHHLLNSAAFIQDTNLDNYLLSSMASMIPTTSLKTNKNKTTTIALVGPTGVGKTTCIAKLAVISKIIHKLKVGLISIDTYRLGAIDQLRIFSEISDIEMAVAYEPDDMPKLLKKFKGKDLIFIDTVGRNQKAKENLMSIQKYLSAIHVDKTILVVNTATSARTLNDVAEKFKVVKYDSVIFSKIDEAVAYGNIMNIAVNHKVPVMFLSNGQVIPDDIVSADPSFLANLVYTGKLYK